MKDQVAGGAFARLRTLFPEREFFMRSQGKVRFIKVSTRLQVIVAALIALLLVAWIGTVAIVTISQFAGAGDRTSLLHREANVATAENRVTAYRKNLDTVAADLQKRQDFIEQLVDAQVGDLPTPSDSRRGETVSDSSSESARTVKKVSAALPEAVGLAKAEARQLAFVESMTRFADRRSERAADAMRKLGLDPAAMIQQLDDRSAQGGPLVRLATSADGSLDPRFRRMGVSLARMSLLERGLSGVPNTLPAKMEYISSGFGYRSDPFNGEAAFHTGLDFKGPYGAPIYAAAKGTVSFVGQRSGYGNCVEIDHGNGLVTRYAHMAAFHAQVGEMVKAGDQIGAIGSTGRSTGPHLHFEVRINNQPVNPRPFLDAPLHGLEDTRTVIKHKVP